MNWIISICVILSSVLGADAYVLQELTLNRARRGLYTELISFAVEKMYEVSLIQCSIACSFKQNCLSLVFDSDTSQCFLLSKGISSDNFFKPDLPTNVEAFTKDIVKCSDIGYQESNSASDVCFKAHHDTKTNPEAQTECTKDNGFLVQIDSMPKHDAVTQFIQSLPSGNMFFIDGSDEANEDDWRLSNGSPLYLNWLVGEPGSCCKSFEHCVIIFRNGKYSDVQCAVKIAFLCERHLSNVI